MDRAVDAPPSAAAQPNGGPIRIALLGSTGSIGRQTIDVIQAMPERFEVRGLAAGRNLDLLAAQATALRPAAIWAAGGPGEGLREIAAAAGATISTMDEMAADPLLDVLVVGTAGRAGLEPTLTALEHGRAVALANKEVVVMAGRLVRAAADRGGGQLRPVDSEHSAIWQCLWGEEGNEIRRILLTASGGALRDLPREALDDVTPAQALRHPTWNMGAKITIDSASLVNKGMETIEARWLFDVPYERVEVVQHAESIVHSLVEMGDGSVKAQLGNPDMRLPIQCALTYPERLQPTVAPLDLTALGALHFAAPDLDRYPGLRLSQEAGRRGGTHPCVLAAADEVAVAAFLDGRIRFTAIPEVIDAALSAHEGDDDPDLAAIDAADAWARRFAAGHIRDRLPV